MFAAAPACLAQIAAIVVAAPLRGAARTLCGCRRSRFFRRRRTAPHGRRRAGVIYPPVLQIGSRTAARSGANFMRLPPIALLQAPAPRPNVCRRAGASFSLPWVDLARWPAAEFATQIPMHVTYMAGSSTGHCLPPVERNLLVLECAGAIRIVAPVHAKRRARS
jgi:hypothetical protein